MPAARRTRADLIALARPDARTRFAVQRRQGVFAIQARTDTVAAAVADPATGARAFFTAKPRSQTGLLFGDRLFGEGVLHGEDRLSAASAYARRCLGQLIAA